MVLNLPPKTLFLNAYNIKQTIIDEFAVKHGTVMPTDCTTNYITVDEKRYYLTNNQWKMVYSALRDATKEKIKIDNAALTQAALSNRFVLTNSNPKRYSSEKERMIDILVKFFSQNKNVRKKPGPISQRDKWYAAIMLMAERPGFSHSDMIITYQQLQQNQNIIIEAIYNSIQDSTINLKLKSKTRAFAVSGFKFSYTYISKMIGKYMCSAYFYSSQDLGPFYYDKPCSSNSVKEYIKTKLVPNFEDVWIALFQYFCRSLILETHSLFSGDDSEEYRDILQLLDPIIQPYWRSNTTLLELLITRFMLEGFYRLSAGTAFEIKKFQAMNEIKYQDMSQYLAIFSMIQDTLHIKLGSQILEFLIIEDVFKEIHSPSKNSFKRAAMVRLNNPLGFELNVSSTIFLPLFIPENKQQLSEAYFEVGGVTVKANTLTHDIHQKGLNNATYKRRFRQTKSKDTYFRD